MGYGDAQKGKQDLGASKRPAPRFGLAIAIGLGATLLLAIVGGGLFGVWWLAKKQVGTITAQRTVASAERSERRAIVALIAPAPLPKSIPLVERPGKDADGYPLTYVDRPALRSLLEHGHFTELTAYLEQIQDEFEKDPFKEYWSFDAFDAFDSAETELGPKLDAWARATPNSFAPYVARATHLVSVGYATRGTKWAKDTHSDDFAGMSKAFQQALPDLERALDLRPKAIAVHREKLLLLRADSKLGSQEATIDDALALCPKCFLIRAYYLTALEPRWGGSYPQMAAFAASADVHQNSRFKLLPGYADIDRAVELTRDKRLDEALEAANRACKLGDHASFLAGRGEVFRQRKQYEEARVDFDRAFALHPLDPGILVHRADVENRTNRREAAARDLIDALRIDPTISSGRELMPYVVRGLVYDGWQKNERGDPESALRIFDLAATLAPLDREVQGRRAQVIAGSSVRGPAEIAALEAKVKAQPDDFRAHLELDYSLARLGQYPRVIAVWTEFLTRHPNHGRAYLERAGAYHNSGKRDHALKDAQHACELGISGGCAIARRVTGR